MQDNLLLSFANYFIVLIWDTLMWNIALITDEMYTFDETVSICDRNLEANSRIATEKALKAFKEITKKLSHYTSVEAFSRNINLHKNDIVFPMYYGINKPSSKSLIPALCEGHGIRYVGADMYTQALCNDKTLAKAYAREFGIPSAQGVLLTEFENKKRLIRKLGILTPPLIVKPNFGGGSTGITRDNVVHTHEDAIDYAIMLHNIHKIPMLVEEIISGYEVSYIIVGNKKRIILQKELQLIINGLDYFNEQIWSLDCKRINNENALFVPSEILSQTDKDNMLYLFNSFEKVEYMRIDGRIQKNKFYLIELSPDCFLGEYCAVQTTFDIAGYSYPQMFNMLIENAMISI
jgi:D-alanine-D-alanine ligase